MMRPQLALVLLMTLGGALFGCAGRPGSARAEREPPAGAEHPEVPADVECAACHADVTPALVEEWRTSLHGLVLVKCFVCHGSTGSDFAAKPEAGRCAGCHPGEVDSVAGRGGDCFVCHRPHALTPRTADNPHGALRGE